MTEESAIPAASQTIAAEHGSVRGRRVAEPDADGRDPGREEGRGQEGPAWAAGRAEAPVRDQVTIKLPADGAYLSVLRTTTAGLAARLDFTLDEIEDMRIAVDEACAMLLSQAIPGSGLECTFKLGGDTMTVSVTVHCLAPRVPDGEGFAWMVLSALAGSVDAQVGPGDLLAIVLRKSRGSSGSV